MNNYGGRLKFSSPPSGFGPRHHFQSTPKIHQNNHFHGRSPHPRSPNFSNQSNMLNPRNSSPYHQVFRESPKSFTSPTGSPEQWNIRSNRSYSSDNNFHGRSPYPRSPNFSNQSNLHNPRNSSPYHQVFRESLKSITSPTGSPEQWNIRSNRSYSSDNSSSSYFGDVSQLSSCNSPNRDSGDSFHRPNRNNRYQGKQSFWSPEPHDSNPGHSNDISIYIHPSMLEDPWKNLMARMESKS